MNELDPFIEHIQKRVTLSPAEMEEFVAAFKLKRVKKKQFLIQPDFTDKHRNFVLQGALRSYVIDQEGIDRTIQFAIEDWWISDLNSYTYQKPATMFVVALEDSLILQIDHETEQRLKQANHRFETFFRIGAERTAAFHQRRIITALTRTAEERYSDFLETYPSIAQRLPQYAIASYLGMTTEFLSKIRNHKVRKKKLK
jgi:CRP-like cAMP-binding protein